MSEDYEKEKARMRAVSEERGDLIMGDDGYYVYWPKGYTRGYMGSYELRLLADILDEKNKAWDEEVTRELSI
jgi:hypothetical protein